MNDTRERSTGNGPGNRVDAVRADRTHVASHDPSVSDAVHAGVVEHEDVERGAVESHAAAVAESLGAWWRANARDLPWRFGRATSWGVLVSEVMSQQTQMSRVVPYWTAWMDRWPDARALAAAPKADVITAWGRLGYPRRALRLQECARVVAESCGDVLPRTYEELTALPGIGDYTASAVMSFAYGERIAVIDTNIRRVLSRVLTGVESRGGAASPAERALAARALPRDAASSVLWNQSVMELGALVCTAKAPACDACPVADCCAFLAAGRPGLGERRTRPRQRFAGTDRQVRGIVLDALRHLPPEATTLDRAAARALWKDRAQLDACIASLDDDGLIEMLPDGSLRLPR
ncbi:adenine glycosylase [Bifidobacterium sp. DSM 109958]|uniref:Adenine DNA glycosylase n=2 Tax=Bifidobacterium moraviense TaxID=2675323 RepID=A0A7Y0F284_9BIFI|nr:A/G-specific adenine glycosylase [Bifidobacterium sp. DSM 109958]NMN00514.1 adenine glycosylase [Bifidobacterium sp. DSM 109958]